MRIVLCLVGIPPSIFFVLFTLCTHAGAGSQYSLLLLFLALAHPGFLPVDLLLVSCTQWVSCQVPFWYSTVEERLSLLNLGQVLSVNSGAMLLWPIGWCWWRGLVDQWSSDRTWAKHLSWKILDPHCIISPCAALSWVFGFNLMILHLLQHWILTTCTGSVGLQSCGGYNNIPQHWTELCRLHSCELGNNEGVGIYFSFKRHWLWFQNTLTAVSRSPSACTSMGFCSCRLLTSCPAQRNWLAVRLLESFKINRSPYFAEALFSGLPACPWRN